MSDVKEKKTWKEPAFLVGVTLTVLVLGGFAYTLFIWPMNDVYVTKWAYLRNAQPNEIGDALAGVAGTLAFVWIVVTVWLQATDLREQRQEFRRMSVAQEAQADVLNEQKRIFESEQRQRDQISAKQLVEEKLRTFILEMYESPMQGVHWAFSDSALDDEFGSHGQVLSRNLSDVEMLNKTIDQVMNEFRNKISGFPDHLIELRQQSVDWRYAENSNVISGLIVKLQEVQDLRNQLSAQERERLDRFRLCEIINSLGLLRDTSELWKDASI